MQNANDTDDDLLGRATQAVLDQAPNDQLPVEVVSATKTALGHLNETPVLATKSVNLQRFSRRVIAAIAIAATLLAIIGPALLVNSGGGQAYGIETLGQRLLALRSLHVRGFLVQEVVNDKGVTENKQFPIRWFFERPNRLWMESYGFTHLGNQKATIVRKQTIAIDGDMQVVDSDSGERFVVPIDPRTTELTVEMMIQSSMLEQLLNAAQDHFEKIRSEELGGLVCDLYEKKTVAKAIGMGSLLRIWLNPHDGILRRMEVLQLRDNEEPQLVMTLSEIQVNAEAPKDLFPLDGAEKIPTKESAGIDPVGGASAGPVSIGAWYALRLSPTKAIVCWTQRETKDDKTTWFGNDAVFSTANSESSKALSIRTLREFESNDFHWRWSLVTLPSDKKHDHSAIHASVTLKRQTASVEIFPIQFPKERLQGVFDYLQSLTPGENATEKLTLDAVLKEGN